MNETTTHQQALAGRGSLPVYEAPARPNKPQNISQTERLVSALGGSALVLAGLSRRKWSGLLLTACGGALCGAGGPAIAMATTPWASTPRNTIRRRPSWHNKA